MTHSQQQANNGITFLGLLQIVFITLKLCNVITWSWWWVMAPLWMPIALCAIVAVIVILVLIVGVAIGIHKRKL